MMRVLHITPHLGGGVGTVLLNWLTFDKLNCHKIVTLDYANENGINVCKENNIELLSQIPTEKILIEIENSDITVIHFWNHPLLYDFLVRNTLPKSRIIIWSHISGAKPPYVFNKKLLNICDKFIFTTPISQKFLPENQDYILSTGGTERFYNLEKEPHQDFNAGYIGTVDFAKMHPQYLETLAKTKADKIYITGGDNEKEIFKNADNRFLVTGKLKDISETLKKLDVFAYLLNTEHYGTGEQVLQEAMSSGVVPVVLNNPCESTLVKHMETGLIANSLDEYVEYINLLKKDKTLREKLGKNAKIYAKENFSLENLTQQWSEVFEKVIELPKTEKKWASVKSNISSYEIFLESLGEYRNIFENKTDEELKHTLKQPNWASNTKGTPKQYYDFLPCKELEHLCSLY